MASANFLAQGSGILGISQAHGRERVIVTIEGDGVTQYDLNTKVSNESHIKSQLTKQCMHISSMPDENK
jgi:hypothetical protein